MEPKSFDDWQVFLKKVLQANSSSTLILVVLSALIWLIGANVVVAGHYSRMGKSKWSGFKPFAFPFKNFNIREWLSLLLLATLSLIIFSIGLSSK